MAWDPTRCQTLVPPFVASGRHDLTNHTANGSTRTAESPHHRVCANVSEMYAAASKAPAKPFTPEQSWRS